MTDTKPARASYDDLRDRRAFQSRHIGPTTAEIAGMLAAVDVAGMDELIDRTVPDDVRQREPLKLPKLGPRQTDYDELREMARSNRKVVSMLGMGYHQTITPAVIRRNVFENPGWYTAYTPYQPEISQGRLEALLNFQTMVCELTAMDLANASLLDESTAAAESMTLLHRVGRGRKGNRFVVDEACHPQTVAVVETRAEPIGLEVVVADPATVDLDGVYGLLVQYPGTTGAVPDLRSISPEKPTPVQERPAHWTPRASALTCQAPSSPGRSLTFAVNDRESTSSRPSAPSVSHAESSMSMASSEPRTTIVPPPLPDRRMSTVSGKASTSVPVKASRVACMAESVSLAIRIESPRRSGRNPTSESAPSVSRASPSIGAVVPKRPFPEMDTPPKSALRSSNDITPSDTDNETPKVSKATPFTLDARAAMPAVANIELGSSPRPSMEKFADTVLGAGRPDAKSERPTSVTSPPRR